MPVHRHFSFQVPAVAVVLVALGCCCCVPDSFLANAVVANDRSQLHMGEASLPYFKCKGSDKRIDPSFVNDDYCDCPDGSDEPNTSACVMLSGDQLITSGNTTATFTCAHGQFEETIPVHWVNDGLCDCCDGSDETTGLVKCPNVCGQAAKDRAQRQQEEEKMRKVAAKVKSQMVRKAETVRKELKKNLPRLEKEKVSVELQLQEQREKLATLTLEVEKEKETLKKQHEEWEKKREEMSAGCVGWRQTKNCDPAAAREPSRDAGCLSLIASGKSGYCLCGEVDKSAPQEKKKKARHQHDEEEEDKETEHDDEDELEEEKDDNGEEASVPDVKVLKRVQYNFTCQHEAFQCVFVCRNAGAAGKDDLSVEPEPPEAYRRQEVKELENTIVTMTRKQREVEQSVAEAKEALSGPPNTGYLLRTLKGQSFKFDFQDYTYELAPFEGVWQNAKGGPRGTSIGVWGSFGENTYSSWAKDKHDYSQMLYNNGLSCFNGIIRSTEVQVVCGPENKLAHIEEPSMCRYKLVFETPAICDE